MLTCFLCKKSVKDPETLFSHIKDDHPISFKKNIFQCTKPFCWTKFVDFSSFKRHVVRCSRKKLNNEDALQDNEGADLLMDLRIQENLLNFEKTLNQAALKWICKLCVNMNTPRKEIFSNIAQLQKIYLQILVAGVKEVIASYIPPEKEANLEYFVEVVDASMERINSEFKLESVLSKLDLIDPLTKCTVCDVKEVKPNKQRKQRKKQSDIVIPGGEEVYEIDAVARKRRNDVEEDSEESDYGDQEDDEFENSGDGRNTEKENEPNEIHTISITEGEVLLMPIKFQMKKFFELPDVFEKVRSNTLKLQQEKKMNHFINGKLWIEKLKSYEPNQIVIPFHFYGDGVQINNPLGPHAKPGEQQCNYYTFPTVPSQYQSRLENIFVAQLYPAKHHQDFTTEQIYNSLIDIFIMLAKDGVVLNIKDEQFTVFFVVGLFIGDNKEQNRTLGYVQSFCGNYCCRVCKMFIGDIRTKVSSAGAVRRNRANYDDDVAINNQTETGVKEFSHLNRIPCFHVTESFSVDLAHDLNEGLLHPSLSESILYFIDKQYFDLNYLNDRMKTMKYGDAEKGNRPSRIEMKHLKTRKLKMTASEMFFFTHHLTLIFGHLVPDGDPVWQHVLRTIQLFDLCYLPSYDQQDIAALRRVTEEVNVGLKGLFNRTLQHKSHISTHYDELTDEFGPLRYLQTIRYEGKHKEIKNYAKNTNSRRNISFSIGRKVQFKFASRLLQGDGLIDMISVPKYTKGSIDNKEYYPLLLQSEEITQMSQFEWFFAAKATVNGIIFSKELWLPNFEDPKNLEINEVVDIVLLNFDDIDKIFVVCETYTNVMYQNHYECHLVEMDSLQEEMKIIRINDFLAQHHYPVKIHKIKEDYLFRCKRF